MKTTTILSNRPMVLLFSILICIGTTRLLAQAPTITSFTPANGSVGTLVTISGTNLSSPTAFTIGGVNAIVISNTGSNLVGMVMPGAVTGGVEVTTASGTANSSNFTVMPTSFPSVQQGAKLVGTGGIGRAGQGSSVAISADGNTVLVGSSADNSGIGTAYIYTRSSNTWIQQGSKLIGTDTVGNLINQGRSVSLSADGNTAMIGGYSDDGGKGAAWVFIRTGNTWIQQGAKLVGSGAINGTNGSYQGFSVSLSADGNTAIVGAPSDNSIQGAAWVYIRNGGVWTQQGGKLVGTGATGNFPAQGISVSLSADGNTAIIGGNDNGSGPGAVWVFVRSGSNWSQQGGKLVGTGNVGNAYLGYSVSLSADGNTAITGGEGDNNFQGAAWVFTRNGSIWTQQGTKLIGTGNMGAAIQGHSVSLSADGNTAIVGGYGDDNYKGAIWVFVRNGNTWTQQGSKLIGTGIGTFSSQVYQGWSVSLSADGNIVVEGGEYDNDAKGAAWVFASATLPVKLLSFTGTQQDTHNLLHWSTASEQNNKGFELQRSADGEHFRKVTFVNSKAVNGTGTGMLTYSFTDKSPVSGNNYYRLNQVDNDGKSTLSNVVLIKGETGNESMTVELFPNPGSSWFTLIINSSNTQHVSIRVMDAAGNVVYEAKGNAAEPFRFGEKFANGVYQVEVRQGEVTKTIKAVKMK